MAEVSCPDCGGHLSTAVGFGWQRDDGQVMPWVVSCVSCTRRTGIDWTFGIDEHQQLAARVDAFFLEEA
jgi:hypothetical protein